MTGYSVSLSLLFKLQKTSEGYYKHLQESDKLANHLQPLINEFCEMKQLLHTMAGANQLMNNKITALEGKSEDLEKKNEILHQENAKLQEKVEQLSRRLEEKFNKIDEATIPQVGDILHNRITALEKHFGNLQTEIITTKSSVHKSSAQVEAVSGEIEKLKREQFSLQKLSGKELVSYNDPSSYPIDYIRQVEEKTLEVERTLNILSVHHSELELQLQASLASTHNGAFLWRIPEMRRRIRDAKIGRITSIYSPPFYTGRNGYKMCIRAYLNGDGSGEGTHLSIFFVLMKGEYDPLLQWPFDHKVSLVLVDQDQRKHLVQTFKPNLQSSSFQRPKSDMNVASGCPEFAQLSVLDDPSYVKDDVMYIKAIVDTSKIIHP